MKPLLILLAAFFYGFPPAALASIQSRTFELKNIVVQKPSAAMEGPRKAMFIDLAAKEARVHTFWILGLKVDVLNNGALTPQNLCHFRFGRVPKDTKVANLDLANNLIEEGIKLLLSISQGQNEIQFPPGFGMPVAVPPDEMALFMAGQVQSADVPTAAQNLTFRATVKYLDGPTGVAEKIKPLYLVHFHIASHQHHQVQGSSAHGHFVVPPGAHTFSTVVPQVLLDRFSFESKVHYIRMHLHAFAESMEIYDVTMKRSVWKGFAKTDPKVATLVHTDFYSDATGFSLNPRHVYKVVSNYTNPTSKDVDAMAYLQVYFN